MSVNTKMPSGIPYIIGNEAAERFSYYGMKAILTVFMTSYLLDSTGKLAPMDDNESQIWYHLFVMSAFFLPLVGALLSDLYWGKFRIILVLSIIYCLGHIALALDETRIGLFIGLTLIAVGAGGIKPCVSAHVGDQFGKSNQHLISKVYAYFYFSINIGSAVSFALTPYLLDKYNPQVAFGVPGALMILATFIFWLGRKKYTTVLPDKKTFIKDLQTPEMRKILGRLLILNLFLSVFWSLYDQNGSSWVNQAKSDLMIKDISILGMDFHVMPSQVGGANPILVMILIPLFTFVLYPLLNKFFVVTSMKKINIGLFIASLSFLLIAWVQYQMDNGISMSIAWQFLAYLIVTIAEVMIYQTALELSYTQAPNSMKSFIMSFLMLSIAFGNFITAMINIVIRNADGSTILSGGDYFIFFFIIMISVAIMFIFYALNYQERKFIQGEEN